MRKMSKSIVASPEYRRLVEELKARVLSAQLSAARAVNRDLILLYWDIGREIVEKQQNLGWGDAVVERLAADLRRELPAMRGFSAANVWRMRQMYEAYSDEEFLAQAVRELGPTRKGVASQDSLAQAVRELAAVVPWGHHVLLLGLNGRLAR